jgi:hypothetical protein
MRVAATGIGVLMLLAAGTWLAARLWPVPQAHQDALQLLRAAPPVEGRSGAAAVWTLGFDGMDAAAREQVLAEDLTRWQQGAPGRRPQASVAEERFPRPAITAAFGCGQRGIGCLAAVRADPAAFAAAHVGHEALHMRVAELSQFDHYALPFRAYDTDLMTPLPSMQPLLDTLSANALAHVQGDTPRALQGTCADILTGRRLVGRGDNLLFSMIGAALLEGQAHLLADLLAELPADAALPPVCTAALQPMTVPEQSLCTAMRGEFAMGQSALRTSEQGSVLQPLVFNLARTEARFAPHYAWACDAAAMQALADDRPLREPAPQPAGFDCVANALGCRLAAIGAMTMRPYADRAQDSAAMLRLVAAQRWLRQQADPPAQALPRLPASMRSSARTPVLSPDGRWLQIPRRATARPDEGITAMLQVPMPATAP